MKLHLLAVIVIRDKEGSVKQEFYSTACAGPRPVTWPIASAGELVTCEHCKRLWTAAANKRRNRK